MLQKKLLMVIDVFSKFAWMEMLKNKNGLTVAEALNKHFEFANWKT